MLGIIVGAAVATKMIGAVSEVVSDVVSDAVKNQNKNLEDMVFVNVSAADFQQKNFLDVIRNLLGMGFTNVNVYEIRQHNEGFFTRNIYGKVESVSINGNSSFVKGARFARGAHVLVSFHVFKNSPKVYIPDLQNRAASAVQQPRYNQQPGYNQQRGYNQQPGYNQQRGYNQQPGYYNQPGNPQRSSNNSNPYVQWSVGFKCRCEYCNSIFLNKDWRCPYCGAPVDK